jgi:hypothetical protein
MILLNGVEQLASNVFNAGESSYGTILTVNQSWAGDTITGVVGDSGVTFGHILYQTSDFSYDRADASAVATMIATVGLALEAGAGTAKKILIEGEICNTDWDWSAGVIYASETLGALTQVAPVTSAAVVQIMGWALSADTMFFKPQLVTVELT